jgi:indoleamine 2,3-dioxygenase
MSSTSNPDVMSFNILDEPMVKDISISPFMVSTSRGFLPRGEPLAELPKDFAVLESILSRMPLKTFDGSPGLLASGKLGETVEAELPDLSDVIKGHEEDMVLMTALYRDYSFLASAYLLEPCKSVHQLIKSVNMSRSLEIPQRRIIRPC